MQPEHKTWKEEKRDFDLLVEIEASEDEERDRRSESGCCIEGAGV